MAKTRPELPISPRSRSKAYDSWKPAGRARSEGADRWNSQPYNIPGLSFNAPLRNVRLKNILASEALYTDRDDSLRDRVIKNVTVAFRILLFYKPIRSHDRIWEWVAQDLTWPTSPEFGDVRKMVICHAKAREAYINLDREKLAKTFKMTPALRVLLSTIDDFNDTYCSRPTNHRPATETVNKIREQWKNILRHNPTSLLSADFDPHSPDGKPLIVPKETPKGRAPSRRENDTAAIPGLSRAASPSSATKNPRERPPPISSSSKRVASSEMMPPRAAKNRRLSESTQSSTQQSKTHAGIQEKGAERPQLSGVTSAPMALIANLSPVDTRASSHSSTHSASTNILDPSGQPSIQALPKDTRQSFHNSITAMRTYCQLLRDEISKMLTLDHSGTPDLVVSEIAEMKSICDNLQARDRKIVEMLDSNIV